MSMRLIMTGAKMLATGAVGTVASVYVGAKTGQWIYNKTGDVDKASTATLVTGGVGLGATTLGMVAVASHDVDNYSDEDLRKLGRLTRVMDAAGSALHTVGEAVKIAALLP